MIQMWTKVWPYLKDKNTKEKYPFTVLSLQTSFISLDDLFTHLWQLYGRPIHHLQLWSLGKRFKVLNQTPVCINVSCLYSLWVLNTCLGFQKSGFKSYDVLSVHAHWWLKCSSVATPNSHQPLALGTPTIPCVTWSSRMLRLLDTRWHRCSNPAPYMFHSKEMSRCVYIFLRGGRRIQVAKVEVKV